MVPFNNNKLCYTRWHHHNFSNCKRINNNGPLSIISLKSALLCKNSMTEQWNKTSSNSSKRCLVRVKWLQNFLIHTAIGNNNSPLSRSWQHPKAIVSLKALLQRPTSLQILQLQISSHWIVALINRILRCQCPLSSRRWAPAAHLQMSSKNGKTTPWYLKVRSYSPALWQIQQRLRSFKLNLPAPLISSKRISLLLLLSKHQCSNLKTPKCLTVWSLVKPYLNSNSNYSRPSLLWLQTIMICWALFASRRRTTR